MKNTTIFPLERNHYFYGKLLTVRDFEQEQRYFNDKRRLINRILHGAGIASGLHVSKSDDMTLLIDGGLALDYQGREIAMPQPEIKALSMLEGYDTIRKSKQAYLCLRYDEVMREKVSAVGAEDSAQSNKCREGYALYLSADEPDIFAILEENGEQFAVALCQREDISALFLYPVAVVAGEEFSVSCMILKSAELLPVSLHISFSSSYVTDAEGNGAVTLDFSEDPDDIRPFYEFSFRLRAEGAHDMLAPISNEPLKITLRLGDEISHFVAQPPQDIYFAGDAETARQYSERKKSFSARFSEDLPIVLAKLDIVNTAAGTLIRGIQDNPFSQTIRTKDGAQKSGGGGLLDVHTAVDVLKSWQKPEVHSFFNNATGTLDLKFSLPSTEANDYATSTGVVNIPFTGGMKVNGRYFSDEIPHDLGIGNVSVTLAAEFEDEGKEALLFGNGEVFRGKSGVKSAPQVVLAAVLYPAHGTFRIGVWLQDAVIGTSIRVRYFVTRTTSDVEEMKKQSSVSLRVVPEVQRMHARDRLHMKAVVNGSDDKGVIWSVKDKNGGSIDAQGIYQAPDLMGTYEIVATSRADQNVFSSAFVIVGE